MLANKLEEMKKKMLMQTQLKKEIPDIMGSSQIENAPQFHV
jgi:hypothetical protein